MTKRPEMEKKPPELPNVVFGSQRLQGWDLNYSWIWIPSFRPLAARGCTVRVQWHQWKEGNGEKKIMGTYFNDLHLLSMRFPSAGKELPKMYEKKFQPEYPLTFFTSGSYRLVNWTQLLQVVAMALLDLLLLFFFFMSPFCFYKYQTRLGLSKEEWFKSIPPWKTYSLAIWQLLRW